LVGADDAPRLRLGDLEDRAEFVGVRETLFLRQRVNEAPQPRDTRVDHTSRDLSGAGDDRERLLGDDLGEGVDQRPCAIGDAAGVGD